jgi:GNAT superfamily N-acetyltransferase
LTSPVIYRLEDVAQWPGVLSGIDDVFFQSSNTRNFESDGARALFRERWLGRYLAHDPQWCYVAMDADHEVAGYLVASLDDPALAPRFADITYFSVFKDLTRRFPAHLHVNLKASSRSSGIGSALVQRFASEARDAGATGVHVVTSRGARNVGFYERNGFAELGATGEGAREIVFLAHKL